MTINLKKIDYINITLIIVALILFILYKDVSALSIALISLALISQGKSEAKFVKILRSVVLIP